MMKNINSVRGMPALPAHVEQEKSCDQEKSVKRVCAYAILATLSAYAVQLMNSAGDIGFEETNVIIVVSALTLLVVIPIIALSIFFASRHPGSDTSAAYPPWRSPSTRKELVAWATPIVVIAVFTFLGWGLSHSLDLYKPIDPKVAPQRVATMAGA